MKTRLGTPVNNIFSSRRPGCSESLEGRAVAGSSKRSCPSPQQRLCHNRLSSLRATAGSAAISIFPRISEIASVASLLRNDIATQSPRGEGVLESITLPSIPSRRGRGSVKAVSRKQCSNPPLPDRHMKESPGESLKRMGISTQAPTGLPIRFAGSKRQARTASRAESSRDA